MTDNGNIREVVRTREFEEYYKKLPPKVQLKYNSVMTFIAQSRDVNSGYVKKLQTTFLYEMRISLGSNEHRTLLFATDNKSFIESKKVVLLNSFLKKDSKQYSKEIQKGISILQKYNWI